VDVECAACSTRQPASAVCISCAATFGTAYYCATCRLYDNVDKGQFHCDSCGFCRVGGRQNYAHCATCQLCMAAGREHACRADSGRNACPLCYEDIFTSRMAAHILPCGHALHFPCYLEMARKVRGGLKG
jgi:RING finger/CHY zinc finger protein 1